MDTHLQESGGLRRTAPIQSPIPVEASDRLNAFQRALVGIFVAVLALGYLSYLLPRPVPIPAISPVPVSPGGAP